MSVFDKPDDYVAPEHIKLLFSEVALNARTHELASDIAEKQGEEFLVVGLLKGSFVFMADLVRALHDVGCRPQVDFITISSYGASKESSGELTLGRNVSDDIKGKPVLLVDDILESGRTLHFARNMLLEMGASSADICVLLDKPGKREEQIDADYTGFEIPDKFVVGYGLDYAGYYRELPFIGVLD